MEFNHRQAQEALKNWGMENEPLMDFYYENSGCKAENALCAGGEYVLKRTRDGQKVCRTNALGCALKETGILAPEPVPTVKGALSVEVDGWHYSLYRRLPGEPMSSRSLFGPGGAENARFVGEVIGQLHLKLRDAQVQAREVDLLETVRGWALPRAAELLHLPNDFCQSYLKAFEKLYPALPRQIIHRDPNPGNILLSENGWGMIDLELAERNVRLYDPCYAATAVLSECFAHLDENGLHEWLGIYRSILLGYHSVAKLSEQEKQAAAYVVLANQMICVAWFATQPQLAEVYEVNRRMTRWLTAHFEELML